MAHLALCYCLSQECVDDYVADVVGKDAAVDEAVRAVIQQLEEMYQKYKYAEASMYQQKLRCVWHEMALCVSCCTLRVGHLNITSTVWVGVWSGQ